jgi:hypothetical protein
MPTTVYVGNYSLFPHTVGFFFFPLVCCLSVVCLYYPRLHTFFGRIITASTYETSQVLLIPPGFKTNHWLVGTGKDSCSTD